MSTVLTGMRTSTGALRVVFNSLAVTPYRPECLVKTLLLGLSILLNAVLLVALAFVFVAPLSKAPSAPASAPVGSMYEVQLDGAYPIGQGADPNVPFQGECRLTTSDVSSEAKGVTGITPKTISFSGQSVSCNVQKQSPNALRLKATLKKDGVTLKEISTDSSYGSVSFSA